jgi:hypothetical protein
MSELRRDSASEEFMMSILKIESRYRDSPMLMVPSAAGFPLVFKSATTRGRCQLSTALGLAKTVAVLCMATVSFAGAAAAGSDYQVSAGRAAAIHECSVSAGRYSQHDWGNTEIYQYRACMTVLGQQE